jgi:hypothetical protein
MKLCKECETVKAAKTVNDDGVCNNCDTKVTLSSAFVRTVQLMLMLFVNGILCFTAMAILAVLFILTTVLCCLTNPYIIGPAIIIWILVYM